MTLDLLDELVRGVLATLAYAAVGTVVLALGYVVLDAITPGNLRHLVYADHNRNAAVLAGANVLAVAGIVTTAIVTSDDDLARGVADALVYGLLGIGLLAASMLARFTIAVALAAAFPAMRPSIILAIRLRLACLHGRRVAWR